MLETAFHGSKYFAMVYKPNRLKKCPHSRRCMLKCIRNCIKRGRSYAKAVFALLTGFQSISSS